MVGVPTEEQSPKIRAYLEQVRGAECIYQEPNRLLLNARIVRAEARATSFSTVLENLRTPGFAAHAAHDLDSYQLSARWDHVSLSEERWSAPQIGWRIFLLPEMVRELVAEAARVKDLPLDDRWQALRVVLKRYV